MPTIAVFIIVLILAAAIGASVMVSGQQKKRDRYMSVIARDGTLGSGGDDKSKLAKQRADNIARKLKAAGAEEAAKKKSKNKDKTSLR